MLCFFQGNYAEASARLHDCLRALGRPLPTSNMDLLASLFWHILRQVLHRVYIGRWLSRRAGILWSNTAKDAQVSAREAALIYHKLHQLHLTGKGKHKTTTNHFKSKLTSKNP